MNKILVNGYLGKMGQEVVRAVDNSDRFQMQCYVDSYSNQPGKFNNSKNIPEDVLNQVDCVVDFTNSKGLIEIAKIVLPKKIPLVSGSTGYNNETLEEIDALSKDNNIGVALCSNFSTGAILLSHLGSIAAKYYEYAELIESHHENKLDAPSGTAISIANSISSEKKDSFKKVNSQINKIDNTRGGDGAGINIHSLRLPGFIAKHELIFGAQGENLTITHNSSDRASFMPGVLLAAEYVINNNEFVVGLEKILGL